MNRIMRTLIFRSFFLLFLLPFTGIAQDNFLNEIRDFKRLDSIEMPKPNSILFVGSSSFRMWNDVQQDFPQHSIINRGFGGSNLLDVIQYADQIIYPYKPSKVVIYAGENDIAQNKTANEVFDRFRILFGMIRAELKDVPVVFVSIKPSPSRESYLSEVKQANKLIRAYLAKQKNSSYVDVFTPMLNSDGSFKEIYIEDRLHMNRKGYDIWKEVIGKELGK
ncbi:MAG: GDSL-type esterase/lipase family protein [Flavitalea sp.]